MAKITINVVGNDQKSKKEKNQKRVNPVFFHLLYEATALDRLAFPCLYRAE
jgi:hypothetical protein